MLTEKIRDIVLLATLVGVVFVAATGSCCPSVGKAAQMREGMSLRMKAGQERTQRGVRGEGKREKRKGSGGPASGGAGANIPQYPSSSK